MLPERVAGLDRIWMVAQWKYDLDPSTPWYRRAFFRYIYRPFIHLAWRWLNIPAPKGLDIEGGRHRIFWFENGGFFSSEDQADLACISDFDGYKDVPLDRQFPPESAQYSSLVFPRQKNPRQHRKAPTFSLVLKDRKAEEQRDKTLANYLARLNQVLDQ